jgi:hypothetical protein
VGSIDWTNVLDTLIITVPAIIAAIYAARVHQQVRTPSGKSIGKQVEDALHVAISNNHYATAISSEVGAKPSAAADDEAAKVPGLSTEAQAAGETTGG